MPLALEPIYDALDADLRRFIGRRVADPAAADDLLQEIYLRVHTRLPALRDDQRLNSWVYQIARNAIVDYYRRGRSAEDLPEDLAQAEETDDDAALVVASWLPGMLAALPEKYRTALELTDMQGMTQQALAEAMGISVSGAKSRVQRAREQLKGLLLECCHVELDRRGHVVHYEPRCEACKTH